MVGTINLVNRLSSILGKNIQAVLPEIIKELKEKMDEFTQDLNSLGSPMPENTNYPHLSRTKKDALQGDTEDIHFIKMINQI